MKDHYFYLIFVLLITTDLCAQEMPYVVQVATFAEPAPDGHFGEIEGLYETLDANYIYRYYIDAATLEDAELKKKEMIALGYVHSKIIDFEQLKEDCSAVCQYTLPQKTGKKVVPFNSVSTQYEGDGQHLYAIFFDFDKAFIRKDAEVQLNKLASVLKENPTYRVEILAHTDSKGSEAYNNALSMKRAVSTQKYLTRKGIHRTNIVKKTFGEKKPIALNELPDGKDTEEGRQFNRRVEFRILDSKGGVIRVIDEIEIPETIKTND